MEVVGVIRAAPGRRGWQIGIAEGLVLLSGLYLIIMPWLVGYGDLAQLVLSDMIVGLALSLLAVGHAVAFDRLRALSWVMPALGLWAVLSPLAIYSQSNPQPTTTAWLHNSIGGGVALIAGIVVTVAAARRSQ